MLAVASAAFAAVLWGSGDFVAGTLGKRIPILVISLVAWTTGLLITLTLVLAIDPTVPSTRTIAAGLLGGVFGAIGLGSLYRGLAIGRMGIVAPIAALSSLVPVAVGFLQGDRPSGVQLAGMAAALGGAALAATAPDHDGVRRLNAGLVPAVIAALGIGISITLVDVAAEESAVWTPLLLRASSVPLVAIAALVVQPSFAAVRRRDVGAMMGVGAADNLGNIAFAFSTTRGLLALVSVVAALVPVVTVVLARFVLHEHLTRHQLVGVAFAIAGVVAIAAG
ncbi:MAG TPA: EamA family transporter [Actinomycetota bacterium]